jgi:hypothetical protein
MPRFFLGGVFTSVRERLADAFVRGDRDDLGVAQDGSLWTTIRSGLRIANNRVVATNPGGFPISTIDMPSTNVDIALTGVTQGAGAAIWVQSSADWTAVTIEQESRVIPPTTQTLTGTFQTSASNNSFTFTREEDVPFTDFAGGNPFTQNGFKQVTSNATGFRNATGNFFYTSRVNFTYLITGTGFYTYVSGRPPRVLTGSFVWARNATGTYSLTERAPYTYRESFTFQVTNTVAWSRTAFNALEPFTNYFTREVTEFVPGFSFTVFAPFTYSVTVPETTVFDQKVSIRQSIAGNVQLLTSWVVSSSQVIRSLLVRTRGNEVTVKPYSDGNLVTQVGDDLVYTATGASVNTRFGITLAPSPNNQGNTVATTASITT